MFRTLLLALLLPALATAQTNIFITNSIADQVMRGQYDPADYLPLSFTTDPDEIACHIQSETSRDSLFSFLETLSSFHTRHTWSDTVSADTGIGAARRWMYSKFEQFAQRNDNRLLPSYMQFDLDNTAACGAGTFRNIFAVLPGRDTSDPSFILIEAHADSRCESRCDIDCKAHGADDNGSGTALVLELARVMSELSFEHTIIFMGTVGEEQGLLGAGAFAKYCNDNNIAIKAVQNNDIVGGIKCGHTASPPGCPGFCDIDSTQLRMYSFGNANSEHKGYARFTKMVYEENLLPIVNVPMVLSVMAPEDRTGRGGDHIPFRQRGYTAIRFTSANEHGHGAPDSNYLDHQHTTKDVIGIDTDNNGEIDSFFVDFNYLTRNTVINGVACAMAAIGPDRPEFLLDQSGGKITVNITDSNNYGHYRIGVRDPSLSVHDFESVYTLKGSTSFDIPNIQNGEFFRVSVAAVDSLGVMSLFAREQSHSASTAGVNPNADTLEFRGVNCWPASVEPVDDADRSQQNINIKTAPNPVDSETYIRISTPASFPYTTAWLQIVDQLGRTFDERQVAINSSSQLPIRIATHDWPSGVYSASLHAGGMTWASDKLSVIHR